MSRGMRRALGRCRAAHKRQRQLEPLRGPEARHGVCRASLARGHRCSSGPRLCRPRATTTCRARAARSLAAACHGWRGPLRHPLVGRGSRRPRRSRVNPTQFGSVGIAGSGCYHLTHPRRIQGSITLAKSVGCNTCHPDCSSFRRTACLFAFPCLWPWTRADRIGACVVRPFHRASRADSPAVQVPLDRTCAKATAALVPLRHVQPC
mmetsp:Transcript_60994/g.176583  ORF Transcript_60994/g.176583 Transcript_60994/m.176583 type:complete len:207 (+) Transcript_60994:1856-2476(+)